MLQPHRLASLVAIGAAVLAASHSLGANSEPEPSTAETAEPAFDEWSTYGGDPGGNRFAPFAAITRDNVSQLKPAWTYRTGELGQGLTRVEKMAFEATPIF